MRIFSGSIDKKLENIYIPKLISNGNNLSDSQKIFQNLIRLAKKESRLEGTSRLPKKYGDFLLQKSLNSHKHKTIVEDLRKDDVRDEDIKWWWNMHDLERRIIEKIDDNIRLTTFIDNCKKGMRKAEAAESVRKLYPIYGDPKDTSYASGDNRPLPDELRIRVNAYIEKRSKVNPEEYKKEIEKSTTFNALVRQEIRKGDI
ncbi:MAG: hypothetical protein WC549_06650 [Actinomycetota bacterium]